MEIVQDMDRAILVMYEVGMWMKESGMNPSKWWDPQNMNRDFLLRHTEPNEFYVALVNNKPVASVILQETERNQSWKSVDRENPQKALYIHWLCVSRDFAGQGFSKTMVDFAAQEAEKRGFKLLRLDTNADKESLCKLYEGLGFRIMGTEKDIRTTAFYQKVISS